MEEARRSTVLGGEHALREVRATGTSGSVSRCIVQDFVLRRIEL